MANNLNINAGELRHPIVIQSQGNGTPDPITGSPQSGWTTVRATKAKISTASSREAYLAMQYTSQVSHVVMIRWTPVPLSAAMRVLFGARIFSIQSIENVLERNVKVNLMCQEIDGLTS